MITFQFTDSDEFNIITKEFDPITLSKTLEIDANNFIDVVYLSALNCSIVMDAVLNF
jgi:hypothetical protein